MKAYILHLFPLCGGGERLSLEIASVLKRRGFSVIYVTNSRSIVENCSKMFEVKECYDGVVEVNNIVEKVLSSTGRFVRYRRLYMLSAVGDMIEGLDGLTIDTSSNIPVKVDISYVHYPVVYRTMGSNAVYWKLYDWFVARKARRVLGKPKLLLTNSTWTAERIREAFDMDAKVLHPPVDVEYYAYDGRPKKKIIVTVSRIVPEKNLHLLPRIASKLPGYEWYLVGTSVHGWMSKNVIKSIEREVRKYNIKNFHVLENLPRKELRELLRDASFYVHPEFPEHFGIAVVEAMSAGALPLVYRDGGAWTDVVSKINPELGYSRIEDVPALIKKLEERGMLDEERAKLARFASNFSTGVFKKRFNEYLDNILSG